MRLGALIVVTATAVAALAACGPAPEPPRPATTEEIEEFTEQQTRDWWEDLARGVPMPEIGVIEELPAEEAQERQLDCMREAAIPGVTVTADGGVSYESQGGFEDPLNVMVQQQFWICGQQYPMPDQSSGLMSESELAWLYDFYDTRYRPCLASLGFSMIGLTTRESFVGDGAGYPRWIPHDFSVEPVPTRWEWSMLAERCPLPPLLDELQLPGSIGFT